MAATGILNKQRSSVSPYLLLALFIALALLTKSLLTNSKLSGPRISPIAKVHATPPTPQLASQFQKKWSTDVVIEPKISAQATHKALEPDFDLMEVPDFSLSAYTRAYIPNSFENNWDFSDMGLESGGLSSFFTADEPQNVVFFGEDFTKTHDVDPTAPILFLSSPEAVKKTATERDTRAAAATSSPSANSDPAIRTQSTSLPQNAFEIVWFHPGKRDDGSTIKPTASNLLDALQGPDFSTEEFNYQDSEQMRAHLSKLLSLGMRGEILLKVKDDGFLRNDASFDFALFENVMGVDSAKNVWQEFGEVGVSNSPDPKSFVWFKCDPRRGILQGCFGVVPTAMGGDKFDLSDVGVAEARYIWIRDLGLSKNFPSEWPTEGCDLDAIRLFHAYK